MKIAKYDVDTHDVFFECDDVPAYLCADKPCSECPFNFGDISAFNMIKIFMESYNADT